MNDKGELDSFLLCKIGIIIAISGIIMASITMKTGIIRKTERGEMDLAADRIIDALSKADSKPGNIKIERKLPSLSSDAKILISSKYSDTSEITLTIKRDTDEIRRSFFLRNEIAGESREIERKNPTKIVVEKRKKILIEVI